MMFLIFVLHRHSQNRPSKQILHKLGIRHHLKQRQMQEKRLLKQRQMQEKQSHLLRRKHKKKHENR